MADTDVSKYGTVMTPDQTREWMRQQYKGYETQMNKLYQSLYTGANLAAQGQLEDLQYDYTKAMGQAYSQARQQEQSIWGSNIGKGYKEQYMTETSDALRSAYDQYRTNYLSSRGTVEEQRQSNVESIWKSQQSQEQAMQDYASNLSKMYNYGQQYLNYLYKNNEDLFQSPEWSRWLKETTDEQGQTTQGLYQSANEFNKLLTTIKDGDTVLSETGQEFFDQILNYNFAGVDAKSYAEWLAETDPDLFEWSIGTTGLSDASLDITGMPTNIQQFREMVGAGDQWYTSKERKMIGEPLSQIIDSSVRDMSKDAITKRLTKSTKSRRKEFREATDALNSMEAQLKEYGYNIEDSEEVMAAKKRLEDVTTTITEDKKAAKDAAKNAILNTTSADWRETFAEAARTYGRTRLRGEEYLSWQAEYERAYNDYISALKKYVGA